MTVEIVNRIDNIICTLPKNIYKKGDIAILCCIFADIMITYKEIQAYYNSLDEAFKSQQESNRFNNDRSHNATVFRFMLDHSQTIKMYCGEQSVFRRVF